MLTILIFSLDDHLCKMLPLVATSSRTKHYYALNTATFEAPLIRNYLQVQSKITVQMINILLKEKTRYVRFKLNSTVEL